MRSPSRGTRTSVATAAVLVSMFALGASGCRKGPQDGVVATVNGKAIQQADVDKLYQAQLANNAQQQTPSADQAASLRLNILHELIVEEDRAAARCERRTSSPPTPRSTPS